MHCARGVPEFRVDEQRCIGCGACVRDCVVRALVMNGKLPGENPERAENCIGCQHCLAVCPTAAVGVRGLRPEGSASLAGFRLDPEALDRFIAGRRSVRQWRDDPVPSELLDHLLTVTAHAPTGSNNRNRRLIVLGKPAVDALRDEIPRALRARAASLPENLAFLATLADIRLDQGWDILFRDAPRVLIAAAPREATDQVPDCMIALSYFDLAAQAHGVGTTWFGFLHYVLLALPELAPRLGIPDDFMYVYAMLFGMPAVSYARTAQYRPEDVVTVDAL